MVKKVELEDEKEIITEQPIAETKSTKTVAKAGKRSAKAISEAEVKQEKEERKHSEEATANEDQPHQHQKQTRSRLERRSKSYRSVVTTVDQTKIYSIEEGVKVIGQTSPVKFDASVELHVKLNVDPRQADQNIRDSVLLPAGSGKNVRVAVFVEGDEATAASAAGADLVGEAPISKELEAGNFSFDVLIATPAQMPKLGRYARILGPRGLMPNPKSGTVTTDINKAVREAKAGKIEYRVDSGGNVHIPVGKASFKPGQLLENLQAVITSIQNNKPSSIKNVYVASAHLSTTMGPSIKISL